MPISFDRKLPRWNFSDSLGDQRPRLTFHYARHFSLSRPARLMDWSPILGKFFRLWSLYPLRVFTRGEILCIAVIQWKRIIYQPKESPKLRKQKTKIRSAFAIWIGVLIVIYRSLFFICWADIRFEVQLGVKDHKYLLKYEFWVYNSIF